MVAPIDLNQMLQVQEAMRIERTKQFTLCCIPLGGPYTIIVGLPCTGFANEQKIPLTVECINNSNVNVRRLKVALRKLITYHAKLPHSETKREDIKLSSLKFAISIGKQQTKQFTGELMVPKATALNVDHCNLIEVSHRLEVITEAGGCSSGFVFDIPITIGHLPFLNHFYTNGATTTQPPSYEMAMLTSSSAP